MSRTKPVWQETWGERQSFCLVLQLIGLGPSTLGGAICFIQSIDSNTKFTPKQPDKNTHNNGCLNTGAPYVQIKVAHRINHHSQLA